MSIHSRVFRVTFEDELVARARDLQLDPATSLRMVASAQMRNALRAPLVHVHITRWFSPSSPPAPASRKSLKNENKKEREFLFLKFFFYKIFSLHKNNSFITDQHFEIKKGAKIIIIITVMIISIFRCRCVCLSWRMTLATCLSVCVCVWQTIDPTRVSLPFLPLVFFFQSLHHLWKRNSRGARETMVDRWNTHSTRNSFKWVGRWERVVQTIIQLGDPIDRVGSTQTLIASILVQLVLHTHTHTH